MLVLCFPVYGIGLALVRSQYDARAYRLYFYFLTMSDEQIKAMIDRRIAK